jgi:hypothetical protein
MADIVLKMPSGLQFEINLADMVVSGEPNMSNMIKQIVSDVYIQYSPAFGDQNTYVANAVAEKIGAEVVSVTTVEKPPAAEGEEIVY